MPQFHDRSGRSIFRTILLPLLILLLVETLLLAAVLQFSGTLRRLNRNAEDILSEQVQNRASYLETSMVDNWSDLSLLAQTINKKAQALLDNGTLSLETLSTSSAASAPLLLDVTDDLISTLYAKKVSGIFVIFNTEDLSSDWQGTQSPRRSGLYIRDLDPASSPSSREADLLLERAPISVVNALSISTDTNWQPLFTFGTYEGADAFDFLFEPFQAAYMAGHVEDPTDYGYWTPSPITMRGSPLSSVAYSIPLILDDGTIYGVLGVDVLTDYLRTMLPSEELFDRHQGSYVLATGQERADGSLSLTPLLSSGSSLPNMAGQTMDLTPAGDGYTLQENERPYFAAVKQLTLYSRNAPFESQRWYLTGTVANDDLYAFSRQFTLLLAIALLLNLAAGMIGSILIGRKLSNPIRRLSGEVGEAQRSKGGIPQLSTTGISEIDHFAGAITDLSRDVVSASTRFLRIMEMASTEIGGFELRSDSVFVTENLFPMLGVTLELGEVMTPERFRELTMYLNTTLTVTESADGSKLFEVPLPNGGVRYVRVDISHTEERRIGLAEDVTTATLEKLRIEHDRDYDLLTGLLNRRAFYRKAEALFEAPDALGHAALVMLDLDNLKHTNDRFGHDWGDQYIRQAAQCFSGGVPLETLCARVSGDEFFLFFFGYSSRDELRQALDHFSDFIRESIFTLPSGASTSIQASGGVAWYPEDSRSFRELMKFADFAMYRIKQAEKGRLGEFDLGIYNRELFLSQSRAELQRLLAEECLTYHFQPIVDALTGDVRAYEALMRPSLPTLHSPDAVLKLAKAEGRYQEIERITWFHTAACYQSLLERKLVAPDALLFVNSIASEVLKPAEMEELSARYPNLLSRFVVEITESEELDPAATKAKRNIPGFSGLFALDDYGSGYSSEKNLLELNPRFIKVDLSIIRDIDTDSSRQQIVSNTVNLAHDRGMQVVAEGLETMDEVRTVLDLGVDLLQGYFLARPADVPCEISQQARDLILSRQSEHLQP